ncbi:MAG: hypothetical protein AAGA20_13515 [Planctomycetota bacterium]
MAPLFDERIGGAPPVGPSAVRERNDFAFVEAVGERIALLAGDRGTFEVWMWPLLLLEDLEVRVGPAGGAPKPLTNRTATVVPEGVSLAWEIGDARLRVHAIAARREPGLLLLLEVELGAAPLDVSISFAPALRPMWPAGMGGRLVGSDSETGAAVLSEELGRFAALIGSPDAAPLDLEGGHASPHPVTLTMRVERSRDAKDPLVVAIAGAQRGGSDPSAFGLERAREVIDAARSEYRRLVRDWRAVVANERERWRTFLAATPRLVTDDAGLDDAFLWSKIAIERAWVDVDGIGRVPVAGYGPALGGDRPGRAWYFGADALEAARAFAALGRRESCRDVLRFAASTQRDDGAIASEITLSAGLCDWYGGYPYAYASSDATFEFGEAFVDAERWSGDMDLVRELQPHVRRGLAWCKSYLDEGGPVRDRRAGLTGGATTGSRAEVLAMNRPEFTADWGSRTSDVGDVIPALTQLTARALYDGGFDDAGWQVLRSQAALVGTGGPGLSPDRLAGDRARTLPRSVPHGVATHAAFIRLVTDALFGLDPNDGSARPRVPLELESIALLGAAARGDRFDVVAHRPDAFETPRVALPWQVDEYAPSANARLVAVAEEPSAAAWTFAGPAATTVRLPFTAPEGTHVEGARVDGEELVIAFPTDASGSPSAIVGFGETTVRFVRSG